MSSVVQNGMRVVASVAAEDAIHLEVAYLAGALDDLGVGFVGHLDKGVSLVNARRALELVEDYLEDSSNFEDPEIFSEGRKHLVYLMPVEGKKKDAVLEYEQLRRDLEKPLKEVGIDIRKALSVMKP